MPTIAKVDLVHDSSLSERYLRSLLTVAPGQKLDLKRVESDLQRVYGLDLFDKVSYGLTDAGPGRVDLRIEARQRTWGPDYVQFGLALSDNLQNVSTFDLSFRLNKLAVSRSGAEWRTDLRIGENQLFQSEYYQPFGGSRSLFLAPRIELRRQPFSVLTSEGVVFNTYRLGAVGGAWTWARRSATGASSGSASNVCPGVWSLAPPARAR